MTAPKSFAAFVLALAAALPALAAEEDPHWVTVGFESPDEQLSQLLDSEVVTAGFSFELKGSSYGYVLTLQVDNEFADQTGLVGYQIGRKIDPDSTWYKLQRVFDDPQTYRSARLTLDPGLYWVRLEPIHYGSNTAQPLSFSALNNVETPVPQVPEPGTWAMMALGLGAVGWTARRRAARAGR